MASQASQSKDLRTYVDDTIMYLLAQDHTKHPIKRTDITKHAMKTPGRSYQNIMKAVNEKLEEVYGMQLVELEGPSQRYIIVNKFDSKTSHKVLAVPDRTRVMQSLLMVILSYIYMTGYVVKEADMWVILKKLELIDDNPKILHPIFGDVRKIVTTEYVRQMYLSYSRVPNSDPPLMEFSWGPRAEAEVSKRAILEFVSKMHNDMNPQRWTDQWRKMEEQEAKTANGHTNGNGMTE